ncbi:MAG: aminodeoxychorismate lyase [Methylothermaceae bacteria B42]|nr:MAG: aminodeoxychorismate lyase [Methylothermaceae bacteria B42]HHJ39197.1 endolytic transglycosylase MltG [Methylothermaceae bacterium]
MKFWTIFLPIAALIGMAAGAFWLWHQYQQGLQSPLANTQTVVFEVRKGDNLKAVAARLQQRGWLKQPLWLQAWAYQQKAAQKIKAGEYQIPPGTTVKELLAMMVAGKVKQYKITLVEGWTVKQALSALQSHPALQYTLQGVPLEKLLAELGLPSGHPEGRFFPDTYFFVKNTSDREILRRAYEKMTKVMTEEWQNRQPDLPLKNTYEALILASIVEKETGKLAEQPQIAGVFIRRLKIGMRLQSDPTVIYGMGDAYQGDIRYRDLRQDTPYNTYIHAGLPPTPIAMPGRSAIHAVLHPHPGKALYFVANGDGGHVFSATLKEHNRAVARFLKRTRR